MSLNRVAEHAPPVLPRLPDLRGTWLIPALVLAFAASYALYAINGPLPRDLTVQESIGSAPMEDWHGNVRTMNVVREGAI